MMSKGRIMGMIACAMVWPSFPRAFSFKLFTPDSRLLPKFHRWDAQSVVSLSYKSLSLKPTLQLKQGRNLRVGNTISPSDGPDSSPNIKKKGKKVRVGDLLVEQGLATDIKHASALIMAGSVIADECTRIDSAAIKLDPFTSLRIRGQKSHNWVSRGGLKLEHGLKHFNFSVSGEIAIDVGCSTGGFTHVLLEAGIKRVYSVDVGYGQLALTLRNDPRVVVLERCNARNLTVDLVPDTPSVIVCDASFIPLHKVLPASLSLCKAPSTLFALIKPQFEAKKDEVESGTGGDQILSHHRLFSR
jgi:23S rRNA (cytidine1920-2'-O)/16S rRNA (cytidine1409-2'-O)-methyltransferase